MMVPKAMESATSRFGFFTSPAVNPILFQASAENNEPTCATANASSNPNQPFEAVTVGSSPRRKFAPGSIGCASRMAHRFVKLSTMAA